VRSTVAAFMLEAAVQEKISIYFFDNASFRALQNLWALNSLFKVAIFAVFPS
jgi:hypothetical protein